VLYDHLAPEAPLDLAPATAERIYVGKKRAPPCADEICAMLVDRAARLTVVRLKERPVHLRPRRRRAEALADAGIRSTLGARCLGIAAYTGVLLTHRDHTRP
jgi:siroheme synthase